ncbi:DUF2852 domain-containing protein [Celeribacter marinus]|uniref:DUF2852 domain-containing protein n=1 Tax=Celeribacter marinus TaxID=1397108 RepID=UPI00317E7202
MTYTASSHTALDARPGFLRRCEMWLDDKGKGAWIAATVMGFIFVWPVGLALLAYMIWGKKMSSCSKRSNHHNFRRHAGYAMKSSGNSAFDAYKAETLRRLEEEQGSFEAFLDRLRAAKDKAEFDQFMDDRTTKAQTETDVEATNKEDA